MSTSTIENEKGKKKGPVTTLDINYKKPLETEIQNLKNNKHMYVDKNVVLEGDVRNIAKHSGGTVSFELEEKATRGFPHTVSVKMDPTSAEGKVLNSASSNLDAGDKVKITGLVVKEGRSIKIQASNFEIIKKYR